MPDTDPVVGLEFDAMAVRNADGTWTRVLVTITDAQQRFSLRTVNDSVLGPRIVMIGGAVAELSAEIPQGEVAWPVGNRRFNLLDRFELRGV